MLFTRDNLNHPNQAKARVEEFKMVDDRPSIQEKKSKFVNLKGKPRKYQVVVLANGEQKIVPVEQETEVKCQCHHYNGGGGACHYYTCRHTPANHWGFHY